MKEKCGNRQCTSQRKRDLKSVLREHKKQGYRKVFADMDDVRKFFHGSRATIGETETVVRELRNSGEIILRKVDNGTEMRLRPAYR